MKCFIVTFILFSGISIIKGSHIRAGEIIAERLAGNTFRFTLTVYTNSLSSVDNPDAIIDFGDGTQSNLTPRLSKVYVGNDTFRNIYQFVHTYSGAGFYIVSYREEFRNAGIINMTAPDVTAFYIETMVSISPLLGSNNPPVLLVPPIDKATVGELFTHNPGAIDADGDSLSYKMVVPQSSKNLNVMGYYTPDHSVSFTLDPVTGDLVWNEPVITGIYNIAILIEEWRKGPTGEFLRIGYIVRDMQIRVVNSLNNPPVLFLPEDTCVYAGSSLNKTIVATDPDANLIVLSAFPNTFFSASNPQPSPATGIFSWTPGCDDVREQPYIYTFKAEDRPLKDTLADVRSWTVYVKGPRPTGLVASLVNNSASQLNWNPYLCSNAEKMEIYRSTCDSNILMPNGCMSGISGLSGYTKIGEVPIGVTTFTDNNNGKGLSRGVTYCYLLVAKFPQPKAGESYPSLQACVTPLLDLPVITQVSVSNTSLANGQVSLAWIDPLQPTSSPPYVYNIYRANGTNGQNFALIAANVNSPYTDTGLNTLIDGYNYKIELEGVGITTPASTVDLNLTPGFEKVKLDWAMNVPWKLDSIQIFRSINGSSLNYLLTLDNNEKSYTDSMLRNCDTVCYFIRAYGSYCHPLIANNVFFNTSQQLCTNPADDRPPATPQLTVKGCEGNLDIFYNTLQWNNVADPICNNIKHYNIYYAPYPDDETRFLDSTLLNTVFSYNHYDSVSTAGCYQVAAVNIFGREGAKSEKKCVDDCVFYELPNLITPNGDAYNDLFVPFPVPRGVEAVDFKVYNRWGKLVYSMNNDIYLRWNGVSNELSFLNDGIYYFSATVKYFRRINKEDEIRVIKGWVQILAQRRNE
ncbi:MAG: gliding motility-associated C-terminal domain-containing protein [Cytophagaceae bacterium]|nr:gliding motility-associated C-terminal domain-containing protein [Cytophagaceae bacterium]MDW8457067.1 gliding motility-associated C-terminal domain-containing protein [Cytophagaceae bacterium]